MVNNNTSVFVFMKGLIFHLKEVYIFVIYIISWGLTGLCVYEYIK